MAEVIATPVTCKASMMGNYRLKMSVRLIKKVFDQLNGNDYDVTKDMISLSLNVDNLDSINVLTQKVQFLMIN